MEDVTVRNVPPEVAKALKREQRRRGGSLNQTVIDLLRQSLGVKPHVRSNGLPRLAGTWSSEEFRQFEKAVAATEEIDEELTISGLPR